MPEISIIVPVYKSEKYIKRCVNSIITQTFPDFELILVDDGSPDNSGIICDQLAKIDSRVTVIHKENGGVSSARNCGIKCSTGKYIMFCDSDDYVAPTWCQELHSMILMEDISLAICGYTSVSDKDGKKLGNCILLGEQKQIVSRSSFWDIYMNDLLNMPWNKIYKSNIIKDNNMMFDENLQYNEDLLFVLEYIKHSKGFFGICNKLLNYYVQEIEGSLTKRYVKDLWNIKKKVFFELDHVLEICGISKKNIEVDYYSKWIWSIEGSIASEMHSQNNISVIERYKHVYGIVRNDICNKAFRLGKFEESSSKIYVNILKTRNTLLIMCYHYFSRIVNIRRKNGCVNEKSGNSDNY